VCCKGSMPHKHAAAAAACLKLELYASSCCSCKPAAAVAARNQRPQLHATACQQLLPVP
jgi:hypothetical protein